MGGAMVLRLQGRIFQMLNKTLAAAVILAALSPLAAQARWQDMHQKHEMAVLVAPPGAPNPQPGRSAGATLTLQTVDPAPQNAPQGDWQTANAQKP